MEKILIFGYGSLTSEKNLKSIPVIIKGFKRGWFLNIPQDRTMALAMIKNKNFYCNGALLEVSNEKLQEFDKREKSVGYKRVRINKSDIKTINGKSIPNTKIFAYVLKKPQRAKFNIIQSYLDVVLTGYLNVNRKFAREFLYTTHGWRKIENDRKFPRYPRYTKKLRMKSRIDKLIKDNSSRLIS